MQIHATPAIQLVDVVAPIVVAILFIAAASAFREPSRQKFMAIMIAGAGSAYLNGGLGKWEFAFTAIVTYCAYKGLASYRWIGLGWILHSGWDAMHHLYGTPIIPFYATSSLGCAICDPVIAVWCFIGAPSVYEVFRRLLPVAAPCYVQTRRKRAQP